MIFPAPVMPTVGTLVVSGGTDNEGNTFVTKRLMTTKFPLCCILMELSAQLASRSLLLNLAWRRRDRNIEADALANGDFSLFDLDRRIDFRIQDQKWLFFDQMVKTCEKLYAQLKSQRETQQPSAENLKKRVRPNKLRFEKPWNEPYPPKRPRQAEGS